MTNQIRRGAGVPVAENLAEYQLGFNKDGKDLYIKNNDGQIVYLGGNTISGIVNSLQSLIDSLQTTKLDKTLFTDAGNFEDTIVHHIQPDIINKKFAISYSTSKVNPDGTTEKRDGYFPVNSLSESIDMNWDPAVGAIGIGVSEKYTQDAKDYVKEEINKMTHEQLFIVDDISKLLLINNHKLNDKAVVKDSGYTAGSQPSILPQQNIPAGETWVWQFVEYYDLPANPDVLVGESWVPEYKVEGEVINVTGDGDTIEVINGVASIKEPILQAISGSIHNISFFGPSGLAFQPNSGSEKYVSLSGLIIDEGTWDPVPVAPPVGP